MIEAQHVGRERMRGGQLIGTLGSLVPPGQIHFLPVTRSYQSR